MVIACAKAAESLPIEDTESDRAESSDSEAVHAEGPAAAAVPAESPAVSACKMGCRGSRRRF